MIKMLVSDLDGTLLDHSKNVASRDKEALRLAAQQGIPLCLASGRMHVEIKRIAEDIGLPAHSVSQNGGFVHLNDGQFLLSSLFEPEIAGQIYQIADTFDILKMICSGESNYMNRRTPASDLLQARLFEQVQQAAAYRVQSVAEAAQHVLTHNESLRSKL